MSRSGRLGNICFKKESTWNSYMSGDIYYRASSENLANKIENAEDNALISEIYTTGLTKVGEGVEGSIEGNMYPDFSGIVLHGVLGGENSAVGTPPLAYLLVSYNGSRSYARITKSADNLTCEVSSGGSSWVGDSNVGVAGIINLASSNYDTLGELQVYLTAITGWDAKLLGSSTLDSTKIEALTATTVKSAGTKVGASILECVSTATTDTKQHTVFPTVASGELPSYSFTVNRVLGTNESIAYTGCKIKSLNITSAAKDMIKMSITVDGAQETTSKTDISLTVPTIASYTASQCKVVFEDSTGNLTEFDEIKNLGIVINSNVDDNRVLGTLYKKEQIRQNSTIELSMTLNNTSTQYAYRTNFTGSTAVSMYVYFKSLTYANTTNSVPYSLLLRFPEIKFTEFASPLSSPDRLTITANAKVLKPTNTIYTKHVYCYVVDKDTSVY